jgi:methyl-accepting chemotaxis protein
MKQHKQRKIILIDNRFQLRMAGAFIALQVFLSALFATGLYVFMDSEIHSDLASAHASFISLSKMMLPLVTVLACFSIVLSIVLVTIFVVIVSHKIAGPMYRFRHVMEALAHRRFEPFMKIRPDDQLGELAVSIDNAVGAVKTDMGELQLAAARLKQCHVNGDQAGVDAEIAAIDRTVNAWKG